MKRIIISITNDIIHDRRMIRSASTLQTGGYDILIIGRTFTTNNLLGSKIPMMTINCWWSAGWLFYLEFNIRLLYTLLITKSDILLSVDTDTLLANTMASYILRKPLVIDMHELFTEVPELANKTFKKSIWSWIEKIGIRRSIKRYTVSQTIADQYTSKYGKSFTVVRNLPLIAPPPDIFVKADCFTLIYIGVLNEGRGITQLLQSIAQMDDVDLVLLGKGDLHAELVSLTEKLNITHRVQFMGWIAPHKINSLLRLAHVGVNLLDPTSQSYYLSLANKYFDYIHADLPSLSMDFPEYRAINEIHRTSVLIEDLNQGRIIDAILQLKNDIPLYKTLSINCQFAKQQWNWQSESKQLLSIFDF